VICKLLANKKAPVRTHRHTHTHAHTHTHTHTHTLARRLAHVRWGAVAPPATRAAMGQAATVGAKRRWPWGNVCSEQANCLYINSIHKKCFRVLPPPELLWGNVCSEQAKCVYVQYTKIASECCLPLNCFQAAGSKERERCPVKQHPRCNAA
jgi:hypothetical protein